MPHIKRAWLLLLALAAPVTSSADAQCKAPVLLSPGDHNDRLEFEGTTHDLIIHVPATYDGRTRVPLVVDLHGSHSDAAQQTLVSGFTAVADANNFIVVAPTGYMGTWNGDIAYGAAYEQKLNDIGFMKSLVDYVAELASIDRTRVYATGLSNGGAMSNTLGCRATDVFAGIAPVADPLDIGLPTCLPTQPIAVIGFHGYDDEYVPYNGGPGQGPMLPTPFPSVPDTLKAWGGVMGCSAEPEVVPIQGKSKCEIYRTCGRAVQVGYCSIEGGHMLYWQDVLNVADYAWKFLSQFKLTLPDVDGDGINDRDDNCVRIANPDQTDRDDNCIGDVCECGSDQMCMGGEPEVAGAGGAAGAGGGGGAAGAGGAGGAAGAGGAGGAAGSGGAGRSAAVGGAAGGGVSGSTEQVAGAAATDSENTSEPVSSPRVPAETTSSTQRSGCSAGAATSDVLNACVLGAYALLRRRKRLG